MGDPYEEFYKLESFGVEHSIPYCVGQIDACFGDNVPEDFWIVNAVYVAHASLSSIKWAEKFGQDEKVFMGVAPIGFSLGEHKIQIDIVPQRDYNCMQKRTVTKYVTAIYNVVMDDTIEFKGLGGVFLHLRGKRMENYMTLAQAAKKWGDFRT